MTDTDITIPPEALEAAKSAYTAAIYRGNGTAREYHESMRAACLAMLKAWPGNIHYRGGWEPVINNHQRKPQLILPLPQETSE